MIDGQFANMEALLAFGFGDQDPGYDQWATVGDGVMQRHSSTHQMERAAERALIQRAVECHLTAGQLAYILARYGQGENRAYSQQVLSMSCRIVTGAEIYYCLKVVREWCGQRSDSDNTTARDQMMTMLNNGYNSVMGKLEPSMADRLAV